MFDQADVFAKSQYNWAVVSEGSSLDANRVLSSANIRISDSMSWTMSLMNIMNSKGPRREPWGTLALVSIIMDVSQSITTHCFLSLKYDLNKSRRVKTTT